MWILEVYRSRHGGWTVYCRGSLEDCLDDMFSFRAGNMAEDITQARLISPERQ